MALRQPGHSTEGNKAANVSRAAIGTANADSGFMQDIGDIIPQ